MILKRIFMILFLLAGYIALMVQWNFINGFDALDVRWWAWLFKVIMQTGTYPDGFLQPVFWTMAGTVFMMILAAYFFTRTGSKTLHGGTDARNTHGSARWAKGKDVRKAGLTKSKGVVIGGFKGTFRTKTLRHDGPEHLFCFAKTRSGKGISLILPTLLSWKESVLVLDIKGENYALSAGYREAMGQRVLRFEPASPTGSVRYNPLAEVRIGTDYEISDCQNIALMVIDTDGKGLPDYWKEGGWEWLSATLLHVLYRVQRDHGRIASLADVRTFLAVGGDNNNDNELTKEDSSFDQLLNDMAQFDHDRPYVDAEVRQCASDMFIKAKNERSGIHSSAKVKLALYADPIIATNTSESDFRISDLMNADRPTSLYIIIKSFDIIRLRPLLRIIMTQFLSRLTDEMNFEGGAVKKHYKHRLLMMLDEFTSIGKLDAFEKALGFIAGYGLKAYIFVQDRVQLEAVYTRDQSITSNCDVEIAFTPNNLNTAKYISDKIGKTTIVQKKRSKSYGKGGVSISESMSEVARPLLTEGECRALSALRKNWILRTFEKSWLGRIFGKVIPGDMLIFVAGQPVIYGRQKLFFQDRTLKKRAAIPAPVMKRQGSDHQASSEPADIYQAALNRVQEAQ